MTHQPNNPETIMTARITIQSGIAAGTSHIIDGRVARVGSDPQSDVCLPTSDIPGHALTLEFREDVCRVYNRCHSNVLIGAQVVKPDQVAAWPDTDVLQLGQDIELLLDFDDGQTFDMFPEHESEFEQDSEIEENHVEPDSNRHSESTPTKKSSRVANTVVQFGVILICLAGCVALLVRDQNRKSGPDSGPGFSEIVSAALTDEKISPELVQRLQHAEAQRIRGRSEISFEEYQSIRDDLIASNNEMETAHAQILQFLQTRLAASGN